jgi:succinate dehydrogenase / fumarate reductase cytochrome b subunit
MTQSDFGRDPAVAHSDETDACSLSHKGPVPVNPRGVAGASIRWSMAAVTTSDVRGDQLSASTGAPSRRPGDGKLYRGDQGVWSWVAHRITGVLTFFFLFAHVLDTALVRVSPNAYDRVISLYKNPLVNVLELGLVGAILYHALNGLRVMQVDFWAKGVRFQRLMLWLIIVVWVVVMIPSAYFMLRYNVEKLFGSN